MSLPLCSNKMAKNATYFCKNRFQFLDFNLMLTEDFASVFALGYTVLVWQNTGMLWRMAIPRHSATSEAIYKTTKNKKRVNLYHILHLKNLK